MTVGVVSYGAGNVRSLCNALDRLGYAAAVSSVPSELEQTDRIIFPGVGQAGSAMARINEEAGLADWLRTTQKPFLGICLGMQVLFDRSTERDTTCLGILAGTVDRFRDVKVPHMGWNRVETEQGTPLFQDIPDGSYFYFAHSYFAPITPVTIGTSTYGSTFTAAIRHDERWGVQFHPEKSGPTGLRLLENFLKQC